MAILKVGTRGSPLALAQAKIVSQALKSKFPDLQTRTVVIRTTGDKVLDSPLSQIGSKGLFIKEIEEALVSKKIDIAVHSLKDLTTELADGLSIGAVLKREDPHDCIISKEGQSIKTLPRESTVGTSSLRRKAQVLSLRPDLEVRDLRGNLDTRVRKLEDGQYAAILVALAGVKRLAKILALKNRRLKAEEVPFEEVLPAPGQGALAVEIRTDDRETGSLVQILDHEPSHRAALCERAFLRTLQGGCQVPVGAFAEVEEDSIILEGLIASPDGKYLIRDVLSGPKGAPDQVGNDLAKKLLNLGGGVILEAIRA